MKFASLSCLLLAAAAACGPKPGPNDGSATAVLPDVPFESLDHDQKIQLMKQQVLPAMREAFQRHDPAKFAKFDCKTCHGPDADAGQYHMPNDRLPKLNFNDMSKFAERDLEFMKNEVKPAMAKILKEPEHGPSNPDGFGCLHCHKPTTQVAR
jgi:mono/diheme cytochrome c family protein